MYLQTLCLHTEPGWNTRVMAVCGGLGTVALFLIPQVGIGFILLMDGHGHLIIVGVGHLFIMAAGLMTLFMDGCGFPEQNGDRLGFLGDQVADIMDGLRWDQE